MSFSQLLYPYQEWTNNQIQLHIDTLGPKTTLRDACEYALMNGGKRFRPALVRIIADALNTGADVSQAALGVEFFHTASLIADDLPCMDNDDERRNKPSLHKVYGESIALLASYALIAAGYGCLAKNAEVLDAAKLPFSKQSDHLGMLAIRNATFNTGIEGATGGQFIDLTPPDLSLSTIRNVIHKKTVTLFEISFVLGWLFGGGDPAKLDLVKKSAEHFGMAFQIADDLGDQAQDAQKGRLVNIANLFGQPEALRLFSMELIAFRQTLKDLNIQSAALVGLADCLAEAIKQQG